MTALPTLIAYVPSLLVGTGQTLLIALCSMGLGLLFGMLLAIGYFSKNALVRYSVSGVYTLVQGLPEMLILLLAYFELPTVLSFIFQQPMDLSPCTIGISTLALIFGSYASKIFYGAFIDISPHQTSAGTMLGLNRKQIFVLILLPQVIKKSIPGISNLWLILLKDTALLSVIGIHDLMGRTKIAIGNTQQPFTFYMITAVIYLCLTLISEKLFKPKVQYV